MIALQPYLKRFPRKQDALFNGMRDALLGGGLLEGERLPSSRGLAKQLGIARGTVVIVYDMLASDGLIRLQSGRAPVVNVRPAPGAQRPSAAFRVSSVSYTHLLPISSLRLAGSVGRAAYSFSKPSRTASISAALWGDALPSSLSSWMRLR